MMLSCRPLLRLALELSLLAAALLLGARSASAQSTTTFTYQGQLNSAGASYTGTADLQFRLYHAADGGFEVGPQVAVSGLNVTDGRITAALDFGAVFQAGQPLWLEVDVRTPAGSGAFTTLSPRQAVNPTPLAQGIAGLAISNLGQGQALDQDQTSGGFSALNVQANAPCWQSFTAGKFGTLTNVFLYCTGGPGPLTVQLYAGVGTSGSLLGSVTIPFPSNFINLSFPNAIVVPGSAYTLAFSGDVYLLIASSSIPGAVGHFAPGLVNWFFQTSVTSQAEVNAYAAGAPWTGIWGVPSNIANAYSPWSPVAGGISFSGGKVQIDSSGMIQFGANGENGDTIFLSRFNYAVNQSGLRMELGSDPGGLGAGNDSFIITESGATLFQFNTQNGGQALKAGGGGWGVLSDARAKHDIKPLQGSLDRLLRLRGHTYEYNDPNAAGAGPGLHTGFVAQEAEAVFPEWIGQTTGGLKTLNITGFEALTVESLRELRNEKDAQLQAKQREIDDLKARLERLERALAGTK